jgi:hypothetical protein
MRGFQSQQGDLVASLAQEFDEIIWPHSDQRGQVRADKKNIK